MPVPGRFGAVICAMATPFDDDGRLDIAGAVKLARWLVDNGKRRRCLTRRSWPFGKPCARS
jgi:hypothetical protein